MTHPSLEGMLTPHPFFHMSAIGCALIKQIYKGAYCNKNPQC